MLIQEYNPLDKAEEKHHFNSNEYNQHKPGNNSQVIIPLHIINGKTSIEEKEISPEERFYKTNTQTNSEITTARELAQLGMQIVDEEYLKRELK